MKLTQRTLFQCFDKSRSQLPTTQSKDKGANLKLTECLVQLDVPSCKPPSPNFVEQPISHLSQADFLLPIHIRQLSDSPLSNLAHPLKRRSLENDHPAASSSQEFFRICPSTDLPISNWPKIRGISFSSTVYQRQGCVSSTQHWSSLVLCQFLPITSTERQLELFEQYTRQHPFVDWRAMFDSFQEYRRKALEQSKLPIILSSVPLKRKLRL